MGVRFVPQSVRRYLKEYYPLAEAAVVADLEANAAECFVTGEHLDKAPGRGSKPLETLLANSSRSPKIFENASNCFENQSNLRQSNQACGQN